MFRFESPLYLYLLLIIIPAMVVLYYLFLRHHKAMLKRFGDTQLVSGLVKDASPKRMLYKFILVLLALIFMILAVAKPQLGAKLREVKRMGVEIMLAVDVSNSMLAEDLKPSRLERTKSAINRLIDNLQKDRIGMVVFAADAYIQLPITSDYISAKSFVSGLSTNMVPRQGTSISRAIELATRSFSEQSSRSRAIILITDGESHDDDPLEAAQAAKDEGVIIYTVGIGTPEGAALSIGGEMLKDEQGQIVVSKLDDTVLQQIAVLTGGAYVQATERSIGLEQILEEINKIDKQEFSSMVFEEYNDIFQYFLWVAFALVSLEFVMLDRKNHVLGRISVFSNQK